MRQTKKGRKITRNFRTTKRKRGGMPPRLDERTIKYLQGLQKRLKKEKKQNNESEYKALQYSEESYKKYLADKAQKEAEKKQAEEKAAADAKAKTEADSKAKAAAVAKAKAEAEAKAAQAKIAADEQAKIAAEQAEKAKADAKILEQKRLQKAIDDAAKEERKKIRAAAEKAAAEKAAAEKERIRSEKKAQKKLEKAQAQAQIEASTNSHLSEKSNSSYASAKSHTSGLSTSDVGVALPEPAGLSQPLALSAKSPARTESLPIPPIDRDVASFWSRFFTPGEIEELSRDVDCTYVDKTKFFIPEIQKKKNVKIGSVVVTPEQAISVNRVVCKLIRIFGIMEARFNERQFEFELIWKGTRAIMLATGVSIDTHDIDIEIINRDRREESIERREEFKENRMRLASHICILIKDLLSDAPLSILYPGDQDAVNPDILKISYMVGPRYIPILDLCFNKTYTYRNEINKTDTVIADRNEKYIETTSKRGLYKHPSIASMKREKDEYLRNYTIENKRSDIDKMKAGLFKINFALGKTTDKSVDVRPKPLTEKEKKQLQELINERLAKSKTPSQSQKPSSNSTASKP
jgi:chemotaxis protein histidine kinase CheA